MQNLNKKEYFKPEVSELNSALTASGKPSNQSMEQTMDLNGQPSTMGPS